MSVLTTMAKQLLIINDDFPFRLYDHEENGTNIHVNHFKIVTFVQAWGSTALGFSEMGGSAITFENTYVLIPIDGDEKFCYIYFGERFAYHCPYSEILEEDIKNHDVASVAQSEKYFKGEN